MKRTGLCVAALCGCIQVGSHVALAAPAAVTPLKAIKVDINPNNGRLDTLSVGWTNWALPKGPKASATFDGVSVTFRKAGKAGRGLDVGWWKAGKDSGVTMSNDGLYVEGGDKGGQIEMVISGLPPGRHNVVTYHDSVWDVPLSKCDIYVNGVRKVRGVQPSQKAASDFEAALASFEVEAVKGKDVVVRFQPDGSGKLDNVIISGFEIGTTDPAKRARKPFPANRDEHAPAEPVLTWVPAKDAIAHRVYLGTDPDAVANATPASPEYCGEQAEARVDTAGLKLDSLTTYYWRVDEILPGRTSVGKGSVWSFRVRQVAFPGAEGYGRFAIGGRGGRVIEVTNLNDSGPGSLRAACEAEGPRTVVFRVGGTIRLNSKIIITNPYLTVAGQTAPGDGICVAGYSFGCVGTHDVIVRYLRIRIGDESGETLDGGGLSCTDNAIFDHCSISWTIDEGFSSRGAKNITFQRCLISEALNMSHHSHYVGTGKGHSFAGSIGGDAGSFHHNLLAHNAGRNWSLAGGLDGGGRMAGRLDIRNNVVYNWAHRTTDGGVKELNFVNNFYIPGPASKCFTLLKTDRGAAEGGMRVYMAGNEIEGRAEINADNWSAAKLLTGDPAQVRADAPLFESYVTTHAPQEAYESVLNDVGANLPRQDVVDARIINDVRSRGHLFAGSKTGMPGIIDSQADAGGRPVYNSAEAPADADHDGMPDAWERDRGLDPSDPADGAKDNDRDGYTNLEDYLNGIRP